ncbi:MAG: hypothetical protein Ta2D_08020 [Rickettsiales bacterium]|nr:MAG: hypothetical protein Ta2D_08020 [Rickettsiales bacterium]
MKKYFILIMLFICSCSRYVRIKCNEKIDYYYFQQIGFSKKYIDDVCKEFKEELDIDEFGLQVHPITGKRLEIK